MRFYGILTLFGILLTLMAIQDWKTSDVSGELCLLSWITVCITYMMINRSKIVGAALVLMLISFYGNITFTVLGEADYIPIAMYLVCYWKDFSHCIEAMFLLVSLLIILIPYAKFYTRTKGKEWHLGANMFVPVLPAFALAWWMSLAELILYNIVI